MINKETEELIVRFEGERLKAYKDTGGVWTIGVGHTSDAVYQVRPGSTITKEQSRMLLAHDLQEAESFVKNLVKVPLNKNQYGALVSFTFNLGGGALRSSTLLKKLNKGDYKSVPSELNKWVNDDGVKLKGLVLRRAAEGTLFNKSVGKAVDSIVEETVVEPTVVVEAPVAPVKRSLWAILLEVILKVFGVK